MIRVGIECGQRFWSFRSWKIKPQTRLITNGFAVGPVMIWRKK